MTIDQAMIMCAGMGTRLKPLTNYLPKPLVPLGKTTALGWLLEELKSCGIKKIVLNKHYLHEKIECYIENYPAHGLDVITVYEEDILDTGGGLLNALEHFNNKPFIVLNCDMIWSGGNPIEMLLNNYDNEFDIFLALTNGENLLNCQQSGDYGLVNNSFFKRRRIQTEKYPYIFTGLRICSPGLFKNTPPKGVPFSIVELFDQAEKEGNLHCQLIDDTVKWFDLGTLAGLRNAQKFFLN